MPTSKEFVFDYDNTTFYTSVETRHHKGRGLALAGIIIAGLAVVATPLVCIFVPGALTIGLIAGIGAFVVGLALFGGGIYKHSKECKNCPLNQEKSSKSEEEGKSFDNEKSQEEQLGKDVNKNVKPSGNNINYQTNISKEQINDVKSKLLNK